MEEINQLPKVLVDDILKEHFSIKKCQKGDDDKESLLKNVIVDTIERNILLEAIKKNYDRIVFQYLPNLFRDLHKLSNIIELLPFLAVSQLSVNLDVTFCSKFSEKPKRI